MATVRNLSEHTLDLRCIGRGVAPDERAEVPDDVFDGLSWPSSLWDCSRDSKAEPAPPKKTPAKKTAASKDEE